MPWFQNFLWFSCLASLALFLSGCVVVIPADSRDETELFDYPLIDDVAAFCDDLGWWDLWARVSHPQGADSVTYAWVEVSYVFYDYYENAEYDFLGAIDLEPVDQTVDEWGVLIAPGDPLLDCDYPAEYGFLFVAEDREGDQSEARIIN